MIIERDLIREIEALSATSDQYHYKLKRWSEGVWWALPEEGYPLPIVGISGRYYAPPSSTAPTRRRWRLFAPRMIELDGRLIRNPAYSHTKVWLDLHWGNDQRDHTELPHTLRGAFLELCAMTRSAQEDLVA